MQTMQTLIRRRILWRLIWVYTVCQCPFHWTRGINGLRANSFFRREQKQSLRKHAYTNILKILQPKKEIFQIKNSDIFHISAQNIDCGYSLEPPLTSTHNLCF